MFKRALQYNLSSQIYPVHTNCYALSRARPGSYNIRVEIEKERNVGHKPITKRIMKTMQL
jgi:hypothetical protein